MSHGLQPCHLQSLHFAFTVVEAGFVHKRAEQDAVCFEIPVGKEGVEAASINDTLAKLSDGFIPQIQQLEYLSVGATHTNTFLRACKANSKSAVPQLADETGHLNFEKLVAGRREFKDAVEHGLRWFVLHQDCACKADPHISNFPNN